MQHDKEPPGREERPGGETEALEKSLAEGDYSQDSEVGPYTAALGFTRADIDAARLKGERIERQRRRRDAYRAWEQKRDASDIMAGLRTLWRMAVAEDRPAIERIAERVREEAL